jgi:hypothetical protein
LAEEARLAEKLAAQSKAEQERIAAARRQEEISVKEKSVSTSVAAGALTASSISEPEKSDVSTSHAAGVKKQDIEEMRVAQLDRTDERRSGQESDDGAKGFSKKLTECDRGIGRGCKDAAGEIISGTAMTDVVDLDTRKRLALDLLEKGIKAGDAESLLAAYDIYSDSRLPSVIAFMSPKNVPPIVGTLEKSNTDSAKVRVAFHNLTTIDPFKVILGSLDGSMTGYCNQLRLLKAKGLVAVRDAEYASKALATSYCSK